MFLTGNLFDVHTCTSARIDEERNFRAIYLLDRSVYESTSDRMFMHERVYPFPLPGIISLFSFFDAKKRERKMGTDRARGYVCLMKDIVQCERERMRGRERERENEDERSPPKKQKRQLACRHGGASGFRILLGS